MIPVLRLQARRDRVTSSIWIAGIVLIGLVSAKAVATEYGGPVSRSGVLRVALATPSLLALRGAPNGGSLGSATWFQVCAFLGVGVGLFNTFLATRHGRGDEEHGRRELLGALPLGRTAPLAATLVLGVAGNLVLGLLAAGAFALGGLPGRGALVAGAALAATGLAFLGVALLVGELAPTSRSANGTAATLVLVAYALRGAGDALGKPDLGRLTLTSAWPSWLSPIGWAEQTFAFTRDDPAPLLLSLALFAVTAAVAFALRARRDLGWSVVPERPGRGTASRALGGPLGLAWRLQWPAATGWAVGSALLGALIGSLAVAVKDLLREDPQVQPLIASMANRGGGITDVFVAAVLTLIVMLAAAAGIQAALRLHEDETGGRAEGLLAAPLARARWLLATVVVGWACAGVVLVATALTTWGGLAAAGEQDAALHALGQALAGLPAAFAFPGLTALLVAVLPRAAVVGVWTLYGVAVGIGVFGGLLDLPDAVRYASPFADVPTVPITDWTGFLVLLAVDLLLPALAIAAYRRRDLLVV